MIAPYTFSTSVVDSSEDALHGIGFFGSEQIYKAFLRKEQENPSDSMKHLRGLFENWKIDENTKIRTVPGLADVDSERRMDFYKRTIAGLIKSGIDY